MRDGWTFPTNAAELTRLQQDLGRATPPSWEPAAEMDLVGGAFVCFIRGGSGPGDAGDPGWAGAALVDRGRLVVRAAVRGEAGAPYEAGLLALREGALLERAVHELGALPGVLLVNATGRDHPRRAGVALHLGAVLGLPSVGVTHRPLHASGDWPEPQAWATSPLVLDADVVGYWLRTRSGARPLAIHAGWRTTPEVAVAVVRAVCGEARTPEPVRQARTAARDARAASARYSGAAPTAG